MSKPLQVLESLLGEQVNIQLIGREEIEINGELLEANSQTVIIKSKSHGNEYIEMADWRNILNLTHKVLGK